MRLRREVKEMLKNDMKIKDLKRNLWDGRMRKK